MKQEDFFEAIEEGILNPQQHTHKCRIHFTKEEFETMSINDMFTRVKPMIYTEGISKDGPDVLDYVHEVWVERGKDKRGPFLEVCVRYEGST